MVRGWLSFRRRLRASFWRDCRLRGQTWQPTWRASNAVSSRMIGWTEYWGRPVASSQRLVWWHRRVVKVTKILEHRSPVNPPLECMCRLIFTIQARSSFSRTPPSRDIGTVGGIRPAAEPTNIGRVYAEVWREAAARLGASIEELDRDVFEIRIGRACTRARQNTTANDDPVTSA